MRRLLPVLFLSFAGCATIEDLSGHGPLEGPAPHVYGGVRTALAYDAMSGCARFPALIHMPTLPFSAVLDTLLLPVTGTWTLLRGTP